MHIARMCKTRIRNLDDEINLQNVTEDYQFENNEKIFFFEKPDNTVSLSNSGALIF